MVCFEKRRQQNSATFEVNNEGNLKYKRNNNKNCKELTIKNYLSLGLMSSMPPMKGLRGSGITTDPSSCW